MLAVTNPHKYARIERERRFLVERLPFPITPERPSIEITDTYLPSEQIRLRLMRNTGGEPIAHKLTQKYHLPSLPPYAVMITNIYLTADDYALFSRLPGATVRKRRYVWEENHTRFAVDVFDGVLAGLILAEVEGATDAEVERVALPAWASREVTTEPAFRGGSLARHTPEMFQRWRASGYQEGRQ
jgi:CYTH domain-containing protein